MTWATVTPSRGDRPELLQFCVKQLTELTGGTRNYLMNDRPITADFDLVPRIRKGIELARRDGFTHVFIVEDDDFVTKEYFQTDLDFDFFGYSESTYYNLRNKTYATFKHPGRSSLFTTAFKISALDDFVWPPDNYVFLDLKIWQHAAKKKKAKIRLLKNNPCLGIKHNVGKVGGKGHRMTMKNKDNDLKFLKSRVSGEAFEFYTKMMLTL